MRREELVDLVEVAVPELLTGQPLEHDQHAECRDKSHERRGGAHEAEDAVLDREPQQSGKEYGNGNRCFHRPPVLLDQREEAEERREHRDRAVREVDDPRAAVDEDDALREQRVRRAGAETEDGELDRLGHWPSSARPHWRYCVTSTGFLVVTMLLPLKREM